MHLPVFVKEFKRSPDLFEEQHPIFRERMTYHLFVLHSRRGSEKARL